MCTMRIKYVFVLKKIPKLNGFTVFISKNENSLISALFGVIVIYTNQRKGTSKITNKKSRERRDKGINVCSYHR